MVHWDGPEGWYGEEGGRGVQDGDHVYTHGGCNKFIKKKKERMSKCVNLEVVHFLKTKRLKMSTGACCWGCAKESL